MKTKRMQTDRKKKQQNYLRHKLIESEIINYKNINIKSTKINRAEERKVYSANFGSPSMTYRPSVAEPGPLRPRQYSSSLCVLISDRAPTLIYTQMVASCFLKDTSEGASATEDGKKFHRGTVLGEKS